MKNHKLSTILKLANDLTKQELIMLNQAVVSLVKMQEDTDFKKAAIAFKKGDIVSFKDSSGVRVQGVITKKDLKTLQVTTPDNYYVNIPATYVDLVINPSKKMQDFRKFVCPTFEEMKEIFEEEVGKGDKVSGEYPPPIKSINYICAFLDTVRIFDSVVYLFIH